MLGWSAPTDNASGSLPAPDLSLGSGLTLRDIVGHEGALLAWNQGDDTILIWSDAQDATAAAAPDRTVPSTVFDADCTQHLSVSSDGNVWCTNQDVTLLKDPFTTTPAGTTTFSHAFQQIYSAAYDEVGEKLIGGQISAAGVIVFDDPVGRATDATAPDWTLQAGDACDDLVIIGDRLYGACRQNILIWDDISAITTTTAPSVTIAMPVGEDAIHLDVGNDTLAVSGYSQKVFLYHGAHTLSATQDPDETVTVGDGGFGTAPFALSSDGYLYVTFAGEVTDELFIYDDVAGGPPTAVNSYAGGISADSVALTR